MPANGDRTRLPSRGQISLLHRAALMALGFGLAVGLFVLGVTLVALPARDGSPRASGERGTDRDLVGVAVGAHALGRERIAIKAAVTENDTQRALSDARVEAYLDMVGMPLSHREGPLPMHELPREPGTYVARSITAMAGNYEVAVKVRSPLSGEGRTVVPIEVASGGGS